MQDKYLDQKEIKEIVVFSFFLIQMLAKIDQLLSQIISKVMWDNVQEALNLEFNQKIESIYVVLKKSIDRDDWKNFKLGKDGIVFTPKLLKSVLGELSTIRNQFAHVPIFYDDIKNGVSDLGPGIIKIFLNVGEVAPQDFPLKVKFNEKLLERKNLMTISMGTIYGLEADQFKYKYTKKDTHFKTYGDLFKYAEILSDYAFHSLQTLDEMLNEIMELQKKAENDNSKKK